MDMYRYERGFAAQIGQVFGEVPPSVVDIGLQKSWRAAMKPGQRYLAPNVQISKLKAGFSFVEKILMPEGGTKLCGKGIRISCLRERKSSAIESPRSTVDRYPSH